MNKEGISYDMDLSLKEVVSSILDLQGAVVEQCEKEAIEVLSPPELQRSLSIPELFRLGFGRDAPAGGSVITLESDWIEKFEKLLGDNGKLLSCEFQAEDHARWPSDHEKIIKHLVFNNAVFKMHETQIADTLYYLFTFRFTALSDEKREDILHLCLNESNNSINDELPDKLLLYLKDLKRAGSIKYTDDDNAVFNESIYNSASAVMKIKLKEKIRPFLSSMERRMDKDLERLHSYYTRLLGEAADKISDKIKRENTGNFEREKLRIESIKREYNAKTADLKRKYSMKVDAELVQALKIRMKINRYHFKAMRRKGSRDFHLDWNPLTKKLEKITCEACFSSPDSVNICDDKLHFLCGNCLSACGSCGRIACRACSPDKCGKCGRVF